MLSRSLSSFCQGSLPSSICCISKSSTGTHWAQQTLPAVTPESAGRSLLLKDGFAEPSTPSARVRQIVTAAELRAHCSLPQSQKRALQRHLHFPTVRQGSVAATRAGFIPLPRALFLSAARCMATSGFARTHDEWHNSFQKQQELQQGRLY